MKYAIILYGIAAGAAALWTGVRFDAPFFTRMTGFLPPHYGYSAYAVVPLVFLPPWAGLRWVAVATLLLSGNRAAWVGVIGGWASTQSRRRVILAAFLAITAIVGGNAIKPRGAEGDSVRVLIWKAAVRQAVREPWGAKDWAIGVDGYAVTKAHSDALQILVNYGWAVFLAVIFAVAFGLWWIPPSPEKTAVIALTVQSVVDNRITTSWSCAVIYALTWAAAARLSRQSLTQV